MLIHVTRLLILPAELGIFNALSNSDSVVLSSDGVYNLSALQTALPDLSVFVIDTDIAARGLSTSNVISITDWVSIQSQYQQWITL